MHSSHKPRHLLHIFATFAVGGPQVRTCAVLNRLGRRYRHTVLAMDGNWEAAELLDSDIAVRFVPPPPRTWPWSAPWALRQLLKQESPDLILTYNWGAIDGIAAAALAGMPNVIHAEDGFGPDEAVRPKLRRSVARQLLFPRVRSVVAPSHHLMRLLHDAWRVAPPKARHIPNGIDTTRFAPGRDRRRRAELGLKEGQIVIGSVAQLRPEKGLELLIQAFARLAVRLPAQLLLVGNGPARGALEQLAAALDVDRDVLFLGAVADPARLYRVFDVFALSSLTEQMPIAVMEAMSCGLPVVSTRVGDVFDMVADENRPLVVSGRDPEAFAAALETVVLDRDLRAWLGMLNRKKCLKAYRLEDMVARYDALYESALAA